MVDEAFYQAGLMTIRLEVSGPPVPDLFSSLCQALRTDLLQTGAFRVL